MVVDKAIECDALGWRLIISLWLEHADSIVGEMGVWVETHRRWDILLDLLPVFNLFIYLLQFLLLHRYQIFLNLIRQALLTITRVKHTLI